MVKDFGLDWKSQEEVNYWPLKIMKLANLNLNLPATQLNSKESIERWKIATLA